MVESPAIPAGIKNYAALGAGQRRFPAARLTIFSFPAGRMRANGLPAPPPRNPSPHSLSEIMPEYLAHLSLPFKRNTQITILDFREIIGHLEQKLIGGAIELYRRRIHQSGRHFQPVD